MSQSNITGKVFFNRLWPHVRPHWRDLALALITSLIPLAFSLAFPLVGQRMVDGIATHDADVFTRWAPVLLVLAPLAVMSTLLNKRAEARLFQRATARLRNRLAAHIQELPVSRIEAENSGDLLQRVSSGVETLSILLGMALQHTKNAISFTVAAFVLLSVNWPILVLTIVIIAITFAVTNRVVADNEALAHEQDRLLGVTSAQSLDALGGMAIARAYNAQDFLLANIHAVHERMLAIARRFSRARQIGFLPMMIVGALSQFVVPLASAALALVAQETYVYSCSIADNIAYGRPGATFAQVVAAATAANAHEFIDAQPDGYQTLVGERGVLLSGGQRQRLALARAILKDAPILLLDEPTSALDRESERSVQQALMQFGASRATLVIAHRLSTVKDADEILVLDDGIVAERGTHAQLVSASGVYARLLAQQLEGA